MKLLSKVGSYEFLVEPFHCDFSMHLFMGHLGNHMLNAADYHSSDRGYGVKKLTKEHKTWVLSRLVIDMDSYPKAYDKIRVDTWVDSVVRFFTGRNFRVTDATGTKIYGYGKSVWAMIDTTNRQPVDILQVNDGQLSKYIDTETVCPIDKLSRVKIGDNAKLLRSIPTYYNDVDLNGHINSVKYIEHVLDLWDISWYQQHRLKTLEIAYVAESHQGDILNFYVESPDSNNWLEQLEYNIKITKKSAQQEVEVCRCRVVFL